MDRLIIALSAGALLLISLSIKYWCDRIRFLAAQHKTEQALDHLRAILDAASEVSIIATDLEGTITSFNRGAEKMLGYAAHEMIGKAEGFGISIESSKAKTAEKRLWTYIRKDGAKLPVSLTVTPIRDKNGQVCGYLGIAADASKDDRATRAEEEIRLSGTLVRKTLEAQEKERASLARELHDGIGQSLYYVSLNLHAASLETDPSKKQLFDGILQQLDTAIQEIRSFSLQLRPPVLDHLGLTVSVKNLVESYQVAYPHTAFTLEQQITGKRLASDIEIHLYRIVQEALNNASKHARASKIGIVLAEEATGFYILRVKDDGIGIDANRMNAGLGVRYMEERVKALNGQFRIVTGPCTGTEMIATIPARPLSRNEAIHV